MNSSRFCAVIPTGAAAFTATPSSALVKFRVESRQEDGLKSTVRTRSFTIEVDEPPTLAGADAAPSPVEYALAALATCQEISYRLHADALGVPLDGVAVTLEGDIDLRGFFGSEASIRPGSWRSTAQSRSTARPRWRNSSDCASTSIRFARSST